MKHPTLVGLNDDLTGNSLISNLRACFNTLSVTDTPLSYKNLFVGPNAGKDELKACMSIWANLYGFNKKEHAEVRGDNVDVENYIYTRYRFNPIFTDDYGNTIFIRVTDNPVHTFLWDSGYFGSTKPEDFETFILGNEFRGSGYPAQIIMNYATDNKYNVVNGTRDNLESRGIGKRKLSKPVLVVIDRDNRDYVNVSQIITLAVSTILQFIPGIGTATSTAIMAGVNIGQKFIENPNYKLNSNEIVELANTLSPVVYSEGGATLKYLDEGINLYNSYEKGDYKAVGNALGIGEIQASKLSQQIFNMDMTDVAMKRNNGAIPFQKVNEYLQVFKNMETEKAFVNAGMNLNSPQNSELLMNVDKNHSLTTSNEAFSFMTMHSGGGYVSALPTNVGGNESLVWILNKLNSTEKTPEVHKTFIDMALGIPTGTRAFDELLLMNIENQIVKNKAKTFTIPAQIPHEKAVCIKQELTKYGIVVNGSGYPNTPPKELKENSLDIITKKKILRNFK